MAVSPLSIANAFLKIAKEENKTLTNLQLQKLVYFAHGWHLALTGQPLIDTPVKAWNFGPVIPPLYNALKKYGNGYVSEFISKIDSSGQEVQCDPPSDHFIGTLVKRIWEIYGHLSGGQLSALTHEPDSPWNAVYRQSPFNEIPDETIRAFFKSRMK